MGLWLEHRDESGTLVDRGRFYGDRVLMQEMPDSQGDGPLELTTAEAMALAKTSVHMDLSRRPWVLRLSFDD